MQPLCSRGPRKRGQNQNLLHQPDFLRGVKMGTAELLRNPYVLGVPKKGDKITSGYITPAFSRVQDWAQLTYNPYILNPPQDGDKITSGYLTLAFLRAQDWAHLLCNPYVLGVPIRGDKIAEGGNTLAFLGAQDCRIATWPCVLRGH